MKKYEVTVYGRKWSPLAKEIIESENPDIDATMVFEKYEKDNDLMGYSYKEV